jgi:hypothetical protein
MATPPDQMTEDELLERARKAAARAVTLPPGSLGRAIQWAADDNYAAELGRRAVAFAVRLGEDT